jgi:ABC-type polar amino acid transport system ATPase subunit
LIEVRGLVKIHGTHRILDGIDLDVAPGTTSAFIGPSGSGKSTLLRCLNGLEDFQAGSISVGGTRRLGGSASDSAGMLALRRQLGMVFQQFHLFPHMSALANVMCGPIHALGQDRKQAEKTARELLERVGLADKANHQPDQLSGGQQQRVAIARALAVKPSAMLFDEPTSALDPRNADEVMQVIQKLAEGGMTTLIVTHAMGFARRVADRVHFMAGGRIVEAETPEVFFRTPRSAEARDFLRTASHERI